MSYTATVRELQYRDPVANSDKFYRAYLLVDADTADVRVVFNWGRNGAKGQFSNMVQPSERAGQEAVRGKLEDKIRKGYVEAPSRYLSAVPDDLLELAGVNGNARSRAADALSRDPFAQVEVGTDRLIRMVTGPAQIQHEAITLKHNLDEQMGELKRRLLQAEGSLELAGDVLAMKLGG